MRPARWVPQPEYDHEGFAWVDVVCTDKGRHPLARLAGVELAGDSGMMSHQGRHWWPPTPDADPGSGLSRESLTFRCPRCRKHTYVKPDRWWPALRALAAGGVSKTELDVSLLPF
ncbi:hypothetical protein FHU33_3915 [Blastococcus colisei]|uniref:Uncharacterized protein n=1 Tax=Blastococcus colisei TaxID=1564162 RepID=A0A543PK37_9ACTN|nr:hypothetical protein FHU33_3915 [Blastococcus colisei]